MRLGAPDRPASAMEVDADRSRRPRRSARAHHQRTHATSVVFEHRPFGPHEGRGRHIGQRSRRIEERALGPDRPAMRVRIVVDELPNQELSLRIELVSAVVPRAAARLRA
jgi:hypothetical protein